MRFPTLLIAMLCLVAAPSARVAAALEPDQIALIVNKNLPVSTRLAEYYAQVRHIPDGRIIALDLPGSEDISFDRYEREVIPAVRQFLRSNQLEDKVKCLVTFYGVPLRIGQRINSPEESKELGSIQNQLRELPQQIISTVGEIEKLAKELDDKFTPAGETDLDGLARRVDAAMHSISVSGKSIPDQKKQIEILAKAVTFLERLNGQPTVIDRLARSGLVAATQPITIGQIRENHEKLKLAQQQSSELTEKRYDADARAELRKLVQETFGSLSYAKLLRSQAEYLTADGSGAAFDNELALLWWKAYPRQKMQPNPLCYAYNLPVHLPPVMMVMRLDGPQEGTARDIIVSSIKAETEGLKGRAVVDAGGAARIDPQKKSREYWHFEELLADWATIAREKGKLQVVFDQKSDILPAGSVKNVALYVGWYQLRNYVPSCQFNAGAIAYHVASFEMASLRGEKETGWAHGLLNDGVACTIGPVSEPFLNSFPRPDDFFPLVLTGKLTLAEAYWKSTPFTSWMICAIGDPLYTPYKTNPAMQVEDLPPRLQSIFSTTQPTAFQK